MKPLTRENLEAWVVPCGPRKRLAFAEAFWLRVDRSGDGCWPWLGAVVTGGYGRVKFGGRTHLTHRIAYILEFGSIPAGLFVCHKCDVRKCVRPDHLFLGTHDQNMTDMVGKGRQPRGEQNGLSKLTAVQVAEIRERVAAGATQRVVAAEFGVSQSTIRDIASGRCWAHLPLPGG